MLEENIKMAARSETISWQAHHNKNKELVTKAMISQLRGTFPCLTEGEARRIVKPRVEAFFVHDLAETKDDALWQVVEKLLVEYHTALQTTLHAHRIVLYQ